MSNIAICVVAYNRSFSFRRLISSLSSARYDNPVDLYVSIDYSDKGEGVRDLAANYIWNNGKYTIIRHSENLGLRKHILKCGDLLDDYDALIVLEDDVVVAPGFFLFAEQCVEKYYGNESIAGISLYSFMMNYHNHLPFWPLSSGSDVYMMQNAQSWGQVWMKKQWMEFKKWYEMNCIEFDEMPHLPVSICSWPKSSWLKYHTRYCIENKKYFVYPYVALSTNNNDPGTHVTTRNTLFQAPLFFGKKTKYNLTPSVFYDGFFECEYR